MEKRVQPAHAELKSLYSTCLPIAASAAARTQQPTPENHPEDHQGDATDSDVMAALLAGERELNSMHLMAADVVDPAADAHVEAVHAGIAEAAVNAGASILNNALSQVCCSMPACCCYCAINTIIWRKLQSKLLSTGTCAGS